jgi:signal transduction histidine kinase
MKLKLAVCACLLLGLSVIQGWNFPLTITGWGLLAAAAGSSLIAPATPLGTFPTAAVFHLLLLQLVSPTLASLSTAVGLMLTVLARGGGGFWAELRLGAIPMLATTAVGSLVLVDQPLTMRVAASGLVYLLALNLCANWQAEQTAQLGVPWAELRWAFLRSSLVLPLLAAMGASLVPIHPAWILCLAIVAGFQALGAVTELVRSQLKPMSTQLRSTREREQRWVARLKTLEGLSKRLTRAENVETAVLAIQATIKDYCQAESVVHFQAKQRPDKHDHRQTFSMAEAGWLEVSGQFNEEQSGLLTALATTAGFALRMVQGRQARLLSVTRERDQMEAWLSRLRVLLEASQSMASSLSIESVLDTATPVMGRLTRQTQHAVVCLQPASRRGSGPEISDLETVLSMVATGQSGYVVPGRYALPVVFEGRLRGALIVVGESIDPLDRELLAIFAYQLGGAFERARLYQQIVAAEAQVVQTSKLAAVGQLAAGVAHELNTPLASMLMAIEYADQATESQPEQARKRLQLAARSGEKARAIIAKLLHYSREATIEDQDVSLETVVHDVAEMLSYHLERSQVVLKLDLLPCQPVRGNANELHQVLSNLVMNSLDALGRGDYLKEITVLLRQEGIAAKVCVSDHGPGISPEILPRIFEPFFTTRPMGGEGAGLGLSVCQQIIEKHQGRLEVASLAGPTVFSITLPSAGMN